MLVCTQQLSRFLTIHQHYNIMHIQLSIKQAQVDGQDGIYIEENLCSRGQIVGRIDSSFHRWEEGGINYDIAGTVLSH